LHACGSVRRRLLTRVRLPQGAEVAEAALSLAEAEPALPLPHRTTLCRLLRHAATQADAAAAAPQRRRLGPPSRSASAEPPSPAPAPMAVPADAAPPTSSDAKAPQEVGGAELPAPLVETARAPTQADAAPTQADAVSPAPPAGAAQVEAAPADVVATTDGASSAETPGGTS
jgi:hypothetical protein